METLSSLLYTMSLSFLIRIMQASNAAIAMNAVYMTASLLKETPPKEKAFSMGSGYSQLIMENPSFSSSAASVTVISFVPSKL